MKSSLLEKSNVGGMGSGAFITETKDIKIKEKPEIKPPASPKRPLPPLKEEKKEHPIITYEEEVKKVTTPT